MIHTDLWFNKLSQMKASSGKSFAQVIKTNPNTSVSLPKEFKNLPKSVQNEVLYKIIYDGYLQRELKASTRLKALNDMQIPSDFCYDSLPSLRVESREKLSHIKPSTLGQASRISGVNPSDISVLHIYLQRFNTIK